MRQILCKPFSNLQDGLKKKGKSEDFDSCDRPSNHTQIGYKSSIRLPAWPILRQALCVISKPSVNSNWSYNTETINSGRNRQFFVPCNLEMRQMTLKINGALFLYYFKPCTSFQSHRWIRIEIWVQKRLIQVKNQNFCPVWPWNLTDELGNQQNTHFILRQALWIIS